MPAYELFSVAAIDGDTDGVTEAQGATVIQIGRLAAAGADRHGFLRFETGAAIGSTERITVATLRVRIKAKTGSPVDVKIFKTNIGASLISSYNLPTAEWGESLITAAGAIDSYHSIAVPSKFIGQGGSLKADFELRPISSPAAGNHLDIASGDAASSADKPRLTVTTFSAAAYEDAARPVVTGSESYVAFGIEDTPGSAVKAKAFVNMRSTTIQGNAENLESQALRKNRIRPLHMAVGRSGAEGDIEIEITPEKWTPLLRAAMKLTNTSAGPPYTHTFKGGQSTELRTLTTVKGAGQYRFVYPGTVLGQLEFRATLDSLLMATARVMARDEFLYDENAAGGPGDPFLIKATGGYDANAPLSFVGGQVTIDGTTSPCVENLTVRLINDFREKRGIRRARGVVSHYPLSFRCEVEFDLYFETETLLRKFLGDTGVSFPFRPGQTLTSASFEAAFQGPSGSSSQLVKLTIPQLRFSNVDGDIPGEEAIMLRFTGQGIYDAGQDSNVVVEVTNGEPDTWFLPETTEPITVLPA